jgi:hypothetical protein
MVKQFIGESTTAQTRGFRGSSVTSLDQSIADELKIHVVRLLGNVNVRDRVQTVVPAHESDIMRPGTTEQ